MIIVLLYKIKGFYTIYSSLSKKKKAALNLRQLSLLIIKKSLFADNYFRSCVNS